MERKRSRVSAASAAAAVLAVALSSLYVRSEYEKDHFVIESMAFYSPKLKRRHRLVFLTDLHDKEFGPDNKRLINAVNSVKPEAVLIGGDIMVAKPGKADLRVTENLIAALSESAPIFYAEGNHEQRLREEKDDYPGVYQAFRRLLEKHGVIYLSDSSALIDDDVRVSGFDLDKKYYRNFSVPQLSKTEISEKLGKADEERYQILLAHSPLFFDAYSAWGADLTLAGHFHGGTIQIPGLGGLMTPQFQFFSPYCAGTFRKDDRFMVAGRGLGTHTVNIRIGDRPQVCILELVPSS